MSQKRWPCCERGAWSMYDLIDARLLRAVLRHPRRSRGVHRRMLRRNDLLQPVDRALDGQRIPDRHCDSAGGRWPCRPTVWATPERGRPAALRQSVADIEVQLHRQCVDPSSSSGSHCLATLGELTSPQVDLPGAVADRGGEDVQMAKAQQDQSVNAGTSRRAALKAGVAAGIGLAAWTGPAITSIGGTQAYTARAPTSPSTRRRPIATPTRATAPATASLT